MKKNEPAPFISIILIVDRLPHLAMWTLDSLANQTKKDFEIIIVENRIAQRDMAFIQEHAVQSIQTILSCCVQNIATMMNEGLKLAKGRFVQFLFPGDIYLSKYSMEEVKTSLDKNSFPELMCFSYLKRDMVLPPEVVAIPISLKFLKKGRISLRHNACWFSRQMLLDLKGFDARYNQREAFDLLCRIFLKKYRSVFVKKVVTDYESYRRGTYNIWQYVFETLFIIYRNFGIVKTLEWLFIQDHFHFLKLWFRSLKKAFIKP